MLKNSQLQTIILSILVQSYMEAVLIILKFEVLVTKWIQSSARKSRFRLSARHLYLHLELSFTTDFRCQKVFGEYTVLYQDH